MVIAIDFDGTITKENIFPKIGELRKNVIEVIKNLQKHGHKCVLWTCREGKYLMEARNLLESKGLIMDGINNSPYDYINQGRKMIADLYIDDRNIFAGEIDWKVIERQILYSDFTKKDEIPMLRNKYRARICSNCRKEFVNKSHKINFIFNKLSVNKITCNKSIKKSLSNGFSMEEHFEIAVNIKTYFENSKLITLGQEEKNGTVRTYFLCRYKLDTNEYVWMTVITWGENEGYIDMYLSKEGD